MTDTSLRVEEIDSLASIREEWSRLAESSGNIFSTPEWASLWWKHFGTNGLLRILACRDAGGELVAILPLYVWSKGPIRVLRFLGHGVGDELGPVCATADRLRAATCLERYLKRNEVWDFFLGELLPGAEDWATVLGASLLRREGSPVLRSSGGWEVFLNSKSSNFRQQARRRERKLLQNHCAVYRLVTDSDRLPRDLTAIMRLHEARWNGRSPAFAGNREVFHREFAACALERGWLRLWLLEVSGQAIAGSYGFRFGDAESYYQSGRDPAWEKDSVGFLMLAHSIREALDDGLDEYRFLRGADAYKYRFSNDDPGLHTVVTGRGRVPRAAVFAGRAATRVAPVRRALRSALGS